MIQAPTIRRQAPVATRSSVGITYAIARAVEPASPVWETEVSDAGDAAVWFFVRSVLDPTRGTYGNAIGLTDMLGGTLGRPQRSARTKG